MPLPFFSPERLALLVDGGLMSKRLERTKIFRAWRNSSFVPL